MAHHLMAHGEMCSGQADGRIAQGNQTCPRTAPTAVNTRLQVRPPIHTVTHPAAPPARPIHHRNPVRLAFVSYYATLELWKTTKQQLKN